MGESKHVKIYRDKYLGPGDAIKASSEGYIGKMMGKGKDAQHNGALIVTSKAVVFYRKGFFGEVNQSIPLDKITSIEQRSMLGAKTIRIHTSHDDLEFTAFGDAYAPVVAAIEAGRVRSEARPLPSAESPMDRLKKLGELRQAGVVTDAEFEEKKRELLKQI